MENTCKACGSDCNERDELDKAEREIDRLTKSPWKPIETAPRDGTKFIGARFCGDESDPGHEVGWYHLITWDRYEPVDGGLFKKELDVVCEWGGFNNFHRFTHWAPLPVPLVMPNV